MRTQARKAGAKAREAGEKFGMKMGQYVTRGTDKLGQIDDATQKFIRERLLGVTDGGELPDTARMRGIREFLANTVHAPRAGSGMPTRGGFTDNRAGVAAMAAMRGVQLGGLTTAGLALANLTNAFTRQQTDSQIPM